MLFKFSSWVINLQNLPEAKESHAVPEYVSLETKALFTQLFT